MPYRDNLFKCLYIGCCERDKFTIHATLQRPYPIKLTITIASLAEEPAESWLEGVPLVLQPH